MNFLSRDQITEIIDGMTARDIFNSVPDAEPGKLKGSAMAGAAFEAAAERQGHGKETLDRVRPVDAIFLANLLGEAFSAEDPKVEGGESSQNSADSGASPRKK